MNANLHPSPSGTAWWTLLWVGLPLIGLAAYAVALWLMPPRTAEVFLSELGPIELATAALFFAAAFFAVRLIFEPAADIPGRYRLLWGLFAVGAVFVALEELSYGQHLLGFSSPEWFDDHNRQGETNLHNLLGSRPSRLMRNTASWALPLMFVVLPLALRHRRGSRGDGHWSRYLLPGAELITLVVVAQLVTLPKKLPQTASLQWTGRLGELKELYWALAIAAYVWLIRRRLTAEQAEPDVLSFAEHADQQVAADGRLRRAA